MARHTIAVFGPIADANGAPTLATDGASLDDFRGEFGKMPDAADAVITGQAAGGTLSCQIRVWLYYQSEGLWAPSGKGGSTKGYLNDGAVLAETGTNTLRHTEQLVRSAAQRIYFQLLSPTGNSPRWFRGDLAAEV